MCWCEIKEALGGSDTGQSGSKPAMRLIEKEQD